MGVEAEAPAPYQPRAPLQRVEAMQPQLAEASDPKKELWLLRIPRCEDLDLAELAKTNWRLNLKAPDGNLGHLVCDGVKYSLQRHDIQGSSKYAYLPSVDKIEVRPVELDVSIVRSVERNSETVADEAPPDPVEENAAVGATSDQEKSGITRDSSKRSKFASTSKSKRRAEASGASEIDTVGTSKGKRIKHE